MVCKLRIVATGTLEVKTTNFVANGQNIIKFGSLLRRLIIDGQPLLLNVLKGDKSLVDYRPALFS